MGRRVPLRNDRMVVLFLLGVLFLLPFGVTAERTETINVKVVIGDRTRRLETGATTVRGVLREIDENPSRYDRTFPSLDSQLVDGLTIFLYSDSNLSGTRTSTETSTSTTRTVYTRSLPRGRKLLVRGYAHDAETSLQVFEDTTARIVYRGGPEYKAEQVDQLVEKGTMAMLATGYSAHPKSTAPYDDGVSALGLSAGYGLIAVDPQVIPLGTRLYVEGYGYGIAADVGGGIDGRHIDLCFDSHQDALQFGRKWVKVHILG